LVDGAHTIYFNGTDKLNNYETVQLIDVYLDNLSPAIDLSAGNPKHGSSPTYFPVLMPILILALPIYELVMVTLVRLRKGLSLLKPSKDHLSYRLTAIGLTTTGAVLFIYVLTICIGIAALLLPQAGYTGSVLILIQVVTILSIVAILIKRAI